MYNANRIWVFFALKFGLIGLGYAWIGSYGIGSILMGLFVLKNDRWIVKDRKLINILNSSLFA